MKLLHRIDGLTEADHSYIDANSNCFYFLEYPSGNAEENRNNPYYSFIHNLKKPVDRIEKPEWRYKMEAINDTIKLYSDFFSQNNFNIEEYSLVPIPPSKIKTDPLYDARMVDILNGIKSNHHSADIRDLLYNRENLSSHTRQIRPSIQEIEENYLVDENLLHGIKDKIILFDDVLTSGAHFCAARNKLNREIHTLKAVFGFFVARRVLRDPIDPYIDD